MSRSTSILGMMNSLIASHISNGTLTLGNGGMITNIGAFPMLNGVLGTNATIGAPGFVGGSMMGGNASFAGGTMMGGAASLGGTSLHNSMVDVMQDILTGNGSTGTTGVVQNMFDVMGNVTLVGMPHVGLDLFPVG